MRIFLGIVIFIVSIQTAIAAEIQGSIYDISLNEIQDVVLVINTVPEQTIVVKNASYQLFLSKGNYKIKAFHYENGILDSSVEQIISVNNDGNYTLDLILFPSLDTEDKLFEESDISYNELNLENKLPIIITLSVVFAIGLILFLRSHRKNNKKELQIELGDKFEDIHLINVLNYIKQNNNRANQKEIRKSLKLSEAKLSLILSQLEAEGKIRKIKKGRGNIIILN